jgi:hypothetical protein
MAADVAIARAKARLEALRGRDSVAIMYSESATELKPLSPNNLPRHFRKFEGMRAYNFHPSKDRRALLVTHSACTESERLVIDTFRSVSKDLEEHLYAHKYTTCFRIRELDWAIALVEASHRKLLGSEGYEWQWWQDADEDLLVTGRIADAWGKNMHVMDRYFIELKNAVESSLRLIEHLEIEHLEAEPSVPKQTESCGETTNKKLEALWKKEPAFCLLKPIQAIAQKIGKGEISVSESDFWKETIMPQKKLVGSDGKKLQQLVEARNRGDSISDTDEKVLNAFEERVGAELN